MTHTFFSTCKTIFQNWFKKTDIQTKADLMRFLEKELAFMSGQTVIAFSQKLLGKNHYAYSSDKAYAAHLIRAQIEAHRIICLTLFPYVIAKLDFTGMESFTIFKNQFSELHTKYVGTSPQGYVHTAQPIIDRLEDTYRGVAEDAIFAGKAIFRALPMSDKLSKGNQDILIGQMRYRFIAFLSKFTNALALSEALDFVEPDRLADEPRHLSA